MGADEITLQKVSISRIKQEMRDVYYLSDDLVIASFDIHREPLAMMIAEKPSIRAG